ncbi:hypothetical protein ACFQQB_69395 [Nonomuraea rubra]|uniref:hypothetical protein n=1 Tax=Nonomuraea rubra TaxID=46180 RepID=UPI00361342F0
MCHRVAEGDRLSGRPAHDGSTDHGRAWTGPLGTSTSGRSPTSAASGRISSPSSRSAVPRSSSSAASWLPGSDCRLAIRRSANGTRSTSARMGPSGPSSRSRTRPSTTVIAYITSSTCTNSTSARSPSARPSSRGGTGAASAAPSAWWRQ